ncbi:hypothetical protein Tsubulata_007576 [Turnera subulata]|uniref:Pentacotripeptide-repeat region of PRORP domain-containing protein n=1 Tax=Turnera subulata TaxID=218843 RepID=A0A9Q0FI93_9ROSI|nr:hypothetical protein Tsubulata_007576 [Turnera subulata]
MEMPVRNCDPDLYTYSTLMDGLCREDRIEEAVSLLDEMQIEGCFPNPVSFNVLINGLCKKGDLARAAKLVDNMFLKGCVPNQVTYNTLIHGLCLKGKLDKAISLLDRMVSSKCMPNGVTYGTVINGLVRQRRAMDGVRVVISMEERGYHSSISRAVDLLNNMLDRGCDPDLVTCNIFLKTLGEKLEPPQDGREFLDELVIRLFKQQRFVANRTRISLKVVA